MGKWNWNNWYDDASPILRSIFEFEDYIDTHPHFPRRGPVCHINSCKALEFFRKYNVKAKLVCFDPKKLHKVTYPGLSPNHVWVDIPEAKLYYDAHSMRVYSHENHPYGDKKLFSKPKFDRLDQIFPKHFMKAWARGKGEAITYED